MFFSCVKMAGPSDCMLLLGGKPAVCALSSDGNILLKQGQAALRSLRQYTRSLKVILCYMHCQYVLHALVWRN